MIFTADKLKEARDAGYSDEEIWNHVGSVDNRFNAAKSEGYSLDEVATFFSNQKPAGTSIGQEISQIPSALVQSIGQPLEAIGQTAEVAGLKTVGGALKGVIQEPQDYVSAGQKFMQPQEGEFQIAGFAPQYAPRAIVEQTGQLLGSIGSSIAGKMVGGPIGAFAAPAIFEAAQIVGPVALERAKNNGYSDPTNEDLAYAIATAAGSGLLNAFGAKYLPGGEKAVGSFAKRLAASFIGEGIPEGLQSLVQQVGETIETKKGIQVSPKQAVGEALIGGAAGAAATTISAPFTPEQIAEAKITESANKEAENLFIGNDNPQGKAVLANKQKLEQEIADTKQVLQAIESTDPIAQKLKLELKEKEAILAAAQGQVDSIVESADPVAEAERQQIELAKAITAPEATAPTEQVAQPIEEAVAQPIEIPTPTAEAPVAAPVEQVVTPPVEVAPTIAEAAPVAIVPPKVENVSSIPTPEESKKWDDLSAYQKPIIESQETESLDLLASRVGVKRQGVSDIKLQEKIITNTHPDDIQDALVELKLSPPAPVTEQAAPAEAPAPEVAPAEEKLFQPDDELVMRSPYTGEDTIVSYRGKPSDGQAVVWTGKMQMQIPESWLRKKGEEFTGKETEGEAAPKIVAEEIVQETPKEEIEKPIPKTKKGLVEELAGEKPKDYVLAQDWKKTVAALNKQTKEELAFKVSNYREQDKKLKATQKITSELFPKIKETVDAAGTKWVQALKTIASENGLEKWTTIEGNSKGEEIYRLANRIAYSQINVPKAPTPAVSETITEPVLPKLQREKADTDFASIDEITDIIQESSAKGTDKSESKILAINLVKNYINESIDWVRDTFGSAPEKVGFDASQMKKWLQNAVSIRPVTEDEFTRGIIKKKGQLTKEGRDRGKIDVSVISPMESRMIALHEASHFLYHLDEDKQIPEKVLNSIKNKRLMPDKFPNPGKGIKERFADAFTNWAFTKMHPEYASEFPSVPQEFVSWIESEAINEPLDYISSVNKIRKQKQAKPKLGEKGGVLIPTKEDFIQAGQNIYEAGMEFGTWAKQMIQRFGDAVREFLGEVWQAVSGAPAKLNELMGYLPKKGETGALSVGKTGKLERYTDRGTIVKLAIKQEKDTPKGILSETIKIIKDRVFDGDSTPSESATKKAWGLIERLQITNPDSAGNAEAINQLTRETMQEVGVAEDATEGERQAFETIKQTVGATKLNNELFKYAIKLAGQGDNSMLNYLLNNELNVVGTSVKSRGDVGRTLGALAGLKSYIIQANEAEQAGFTQLAAQRFFNTTTPTEDQIVKIKSILTAVNETKVNEEEAILDELTQVGEKLGTELVENINTQIDKASKPEVKDPMVAAITAMLKLGGTFVYKKTKNKIKAAVEKTIKSGITNYRDKLVEGAANGLETGFWKTLASEQKRIGPLGELDAAQNRELGNIVKSTLVSLGLERKLGKPLAPDEKKMDIYEQVASILGEKPLSKDKAELADKKIREEINRKRENELKETEDQEAQDAINLKYDQIENAWDMAMSRQLDMPVGDAMLRRLIFNELKEAKTSINELATLMNEDPTIGTSRQDRIVSAIINKIAGVTFEGQNPADYTAFKEYLSNELESLVQGEQTKKKVVKTKEKVKANQGLSELNKLARIQSDTPNFPTSEKIANPVRDAVRNALKLNLNVMFDPKAAADIMRNWKKEFAAELQQLGVDEATALTLTDVVGRQIELDSVSRNLDSIDNAINKGALTGVINAIKNTPLADQQKPNWRYEVMRDYLRNAGLSATQAERIAKLMDISLQKRFAKAQEEAAASIAKKLLKGINPESNRGFTALIQAIRAQVLNPGSNVAMEFGMAMGWKGFTAEQLKTLNELDSKINDETITEAERAVALEGIKKIIDKVALPTRVRDAISAFYIGNALLRIPVASVQVIDPAIFDLWDASVASAKNITSPELAMQIWGNYISSLINAGREFAFSFKNDVNRSGRLVDYLETQDRKLKRLRNDADNLWKNGQYKQAIKKYLFSYPEITSRVLKALDDASFSLLQQNALNQYMISAMNMAKIPKKDQLGALRMIAQARQMDIANMMADGISKNDAIIYANERMKAEISRVMSGLNLNSTEIIDSAINDSLARIGKNRYKEQFSKEAEIKDKGTLSYPFLKMYEGTSRLAADVKGVRGEVMRIFQRMLFGFPLIVAKVGNVAYGYTPLTLYRHILKGSYPLTYGTAIQRRKRLVEQLTGFAVLVPLLFLRSMSFDDDDDKKPISIVFTGFGPVRSKDPEAYNQWHKKHNPGSLELFIGGKRYALDSKSAGPLKPMIEILGAIDDWQIRKFQDGAKMTKEEMKKAQENAGLLGTLGEIAGSLFLTAARRGPATGLMQGLIDFRRYPDDPIAAIAQEASFSFTPLIPVVGAGITKNLSDLLSEPIDTRTKEGAILNNLPIIGPMFGKPAINAFGQPIGDVQISEKIRRSIGIPITLVSVSSGDDAKLAKITLKNANGPEPLQRSWFDKRFETPLSDQEWRTVNEDYARSNRKLVLENYEMLNSFEPEIYKTAISQIGTASKNISLGKLYESRKKP